MKNTIQIEPVEILNPTGKNSVCTCGGDEACSECPKNKYTEYEVHPLSSGPGKQYKDAIIFGISDEMNRLKARTLNLIESLGLSESQEQSAKKLFKDFAAESYWSTTKRVIDYLHGQEWIDDTEKHFMESTQKSDYIQKGE